MALPYSFLHAWKPDRYSAPYLRLGLSEAQVQAFVIAELRQRGIICWPVDVGAKSLRGRAYGALRRGGMSASSAGGVLLGRTGAGVAGMCDVIGIMPADGRAVCIEVKAPAWFSASIKTGKLIQKRAPGKPAPEQLEFLANAARSGAVVGVVWASTDLRAIFEAASIDAAVASW